MKGPLAFALVILLLLPGLAPTVDAWHLPGHVDAPDVEEPFCAEPTQANDVGVCDGPLTNPETGIIPVDRQINDTANTIFSTVDGIRSTYRVVGETLNTVIDTATDAVEQPVTLMRDGAGGTTPADQRDLREGGFGDWKIVGSQAWGTSPDAAARGDKGYTSATDEGGLYFGGAKALFVSPELDLRTNFFMDARLDPDGRVGTACAQDDSVEGTGLVATAQDACPSDASAIYNGHTGSNVYAGIYWACNEAAFVAGVAGVPLFCGPYREFVQSQHTYVSLELARRFNLANGLDGASVMIFTREPQSVDDAAACTPPLERGDELAPTLYDIPDCQIAIPQNGYSSASVRGLPQQRGFTGFSDWSTESFDLTLWEGLSVWVGIYFVSKTVLGPSYFESGRFNTGAGFYGFQFDDVAVRAPAAAVNLATRPITSPASDRSDVAPVVPLGDPVAVRTNVTNFGSTSIDFVVVSRLLKVLDRSVVRTTGPQPITLPPGGVLELESIFPTLERGVYIAEVCAGRVSTGGSGAQNCAQPGLSTDACPPDSLDADPCDNRQEIRFEVRPLQVLRPGPFRRSTDQIQVGDALTITMPLANVGASPQTTTLEVHVVDVATGLIVDDLLAPEDRIPRTLTVPAGGTLDLSWDIQGTRRGQYRLFAKMGNTPAFDATQDLRSPELRAWDADALVDPVLVDGELTEWTIPTLHGIQNGPATMQVQNTPTMLYFAFSNVANQNMSILFDDRADGLLSNLFWAGLYHDDRGAQILVPDATGKSPWQPLPPTGAVGGARSPHIGDGGTVVPGRWDFEFAVPLNPGKPGNLTAAAGELVGFFVRMCDGVTRNLTCNRFPVGAVSFDGDGFRPPDSTLKDELASWHAIRMAAPVPAGGQLAPFTFRGTSAGFGVGALPPSYFASSFLDCQAVATWTQSYTRAEFAGKTDKWTCGDYADADRSLLFLGVTPGADCNGQPCLDYTGIPGEIPPRNPELFGTPGAAFKRFRVPPNYVPDENRLWSEIIEIPADAQSPMVLLAHQYSTDVDIEDVQRNTSVHSFGHIRAHHRLNVSLEQLVDGVWVDRGTLDPIAGYTDEAAANIQDDRYPPRRFYDNPDCPLVAPDGGITYLVSGCEFHEAARHWWWPQGEQALYQPGNSTLPKGAFFAGGSPWTTDVIPLFGAHFAQPPLDVRDSSVRLRFDFLTSDGASLPDRNHDWGWRIGGLSVVEGAQLLREVSIDHIEPAVSFNATDLGLAPGTSVPFTIVVRNSGTVDLQHVEVDLVGHVFENPVGSLGEACRTEIFPIPGALLAGSTRSIIVPCSLPVDAAGEFTVVATVRLSRDPEDFLGNNQQRMRGSLPIRFSPELAIEVDASPQEAATATNRNARIALRNTGNVPLSDVDVTLKLLKITGTGTQETGIGSSWTIHDELPISGEPIVLSSAVDATPPIDVLQQLRLRLPSAGRYQLVATAVVPGADDATTASVTIAAADVFYENLFDQAPKRDSAVVSGDLTPEGMLGLWHTVIGNSYDGTTHFAATGELPPNADSVVALPSVDLSTLKQATLSFMHRYDLEESYDAGRVEISSDGGATWKPLVPNPQLINGLPAGYPSLPLVGASPLQGAKVETIGEAFTGQSEDLPGNERGWVPAEFELTRQDAFWQPAILENLPLTGLHPTADTIPVGSAASPQFRHETWTMPEPGAEANDRYWWIDNLTYYEPRPTQASRMWWSGEPGDPGPGIPLPKVNTTLALGLDVPSPEDDERVLVRFWDWRPGVQLGEAPNAHGAGGKFDVKLVPEGTATQVVVIGHDPGGWVQREIDVTELAGNVALGLSFFYRSGREPGAQLQFDFAGGNNQYWLPEVQNNRGWFVDRVEVIVRNGDVERVFSSYNAELDESWSVLNVGQAGGWDRVPRGAAANDGGWHIEPVALPNRPAVPAWRFSAENVQGYPNNADSRLVTPLFDLSQYLGDEARLRFDHRYQFHGGADIMGGAVDGAAVEYQILDEATGAYGPWTLLANRTTPIEAGFVGRRFAGPGSDIWLPHLNETNDPARMGYPAVIRAPPAELWGRRSLDIRIGGDQVQDADPDSQVGYQSTGVEAIHWVDLPDAAGKLDGVFTSRDALIIHSNSQTDVVGATDVALSPRTANGLALASWVGKPLKVLYPGLRVETSIQWRDVNGDGYWSLGDEAYMPVSAIREEGYAFRIGIGDVRLSNVGDKLFGTRVGLGDSDLDADVERPGLFHAICRGGVGSTLYFTTSQGRCLDSRLLAFGLGDSFPRVEGWMHGLHGTGGSPNDWHAPLQPLEKIGFSYVFSGDSREHHPESAGWDSVNWDVGHLIGKKFRVGFHAWTTPRDEPCDTLLPQLFNVVGAPSACHGTPLQGWTIANVALHGQQLQGTPVKLRLRLVTDESQPKGEWSIDDLLIVGQRYENAIVVTTTQDHARHEPGTQVLVEGVIRNLGQDPKSDLAVFIEARRADTGASVPMTLIDPPALGTIPQALLPPGITSARGPFSLFSGGTFGSSLPVRVQVTLPSVSAKVNLDVRVLESVERCSATQGGGTVCTQSYEEVRNERGVGAARALAEITGAEIREVVFGTVEGASSSGIFALPAVPQSLEPVELAAVVVNNGTVAPSSLEARWVVHEVLRKGNNDLQPGTREQLGQVTTFDAQPMPSLEPGGSVPSGVTFLPDAEGLYRASLSVYSGSDRIAKTAFEFRVGDIEAYYRADFGDGGAAALEWSDVSSGVQDPNGGTPPALRFRQVNDQFVWGVSASQFFAGVTYCDFSGCYPSTTGSNGTPVKGLSGIAESPLVDLSKVVGDKALLTIRSGHVFQRGDGAVVEALPMRISAQGRAQAAFTCANSETGDSGPAWFRIQPTPASAYAGETFAYPSLKVRVDLPGGRIRFYHTPERENVLGVGPAIGGPGTDSDIIRFDLSNGEPRPVCPNGTTFSGISPTSLVNYTVKFRLRTGTLPGLNDANCPPCPDNPRLGAMGWQIDSLAVSSVDVDVFPATRTVPILDGSAKEFNLQIRNIGSVEDRFTVELLESAHVNPNWFDLPEEAITLRPGEAQIVKYGLSIPTEPRVPRGVYLANLIARSTLDPNVQGIAQLNINLLEQRLPDLGVQLAFETDGGFIEPGKEVRVFATVQNVGRASSGIVPIELFLRPDQQSSLETPLGSGSVDSLCAFQLCGTTGSSQTFAFEWVPPVAGVFQVRAVVDPEQRLDEDRLSNNHALLQLPVVAQQRPDLAVTDLVIDGIRPDGYAVEGTLLTVKANVTNLGITPSSGGEVRIFAGTGELLQANLPALAPGDERSFVATRIASAGEITVRAVLIPTAADLSPENNELRRTVRVRGLDLRLALNETLQPIEPGGTIALAVMVTNDGNALEKIVFAMGSAHTGWAFTASPNPLIVAPEATAWTVITLVAAPDATRGIHNITVFGSPLSKPSLLVPLKIPVEISERTGQVSLRLDETRFEPGVGRVQVHVSNNGNGPRSVTLRLLEPAWSSSPATATVSAASVTPLTLAFQVPKDAPAGSTVVRVRATEHGTLLSDATGILHVLPKPNATATVQPGGSVGETDILAQIYRFNVVVNNTGNTPIQPSVLIHGLPDGAEALSQSEPPAIEPGSATSLPSEIRVPREITGRVPGRIDVFMRAVAVNNSSAQPQERIGSFELPPLAPLPDLRLMEASRIPRGDVDAGQRVTFVLPVHNVGFTPSRPTDLFAYVNGEPVNLYPIPPLDPGEREVLEIQWEFATADSHLVYVVADGSGKLTELDRANNGWSEVVVVREDTGFTAPSVPGVGVESTIALLALLALAVGGMRRRPKEPAA